MYTDRLFLKVLAMMTVRHLHKVNELLSVIAQPTAEIAMLQALLHDVNYSQKASFLRLMREGNLLVEVKGYCHTTIPRTLSQSDQAARYREA